MSLSRDDTGRVATLRRAMADSNVRSRQSEAQRRAWSDPAVRKRQSEAKLLAWADPAKRQRMVNAARQAREARRISKAADEIVAERPAPRRAYTARPCLCCGQTFPSQGPHNRLCVVCRHKSPSPFEPN